MGGSVQVEVTGLSELARDIQHAANLAPEKFEKGMKDITKVFMKDVKKEAKNALGSTVHITSGFKMSPVNVAGDMLWSYFMPEANGNQGHAWHLQEFGYELIRANWKSRSRMIRYKDAGARLGFVPGKLMVEAVLPEFEDYMDEEVLNLVDEILKENNL